MKVLHLPTDVGGNAWGLAQAERALGLETTVLRRKVGHPGYKADITLHVDKNTPKIVAAYKLLKTFLQIRGAYDIFHFNYGQSLLFLADLPFYPKKAKLFVTYNGCDARQKYPTMNRVQVAACHQPECWEGMCNSGEQDEKRRKNIAKMSRYVAHSFALNPDLLHFLPRENSSFLPYTPESYPEGVFLPKKEKVLKIVHAPTNRAAKGTAFILEAVARLQRKYPGEVELILVEKVSYEKALILYREADLVIDQVLIGWYGAFAIETMWMGKPVLARIAEEDLQFIPEAMANDLRSSVIRAEPATLYSVLEHLLHDRDFLAERAKACMAYARRWHDPRYVAGLTKQRYEACAE